MRLKKYTKECVQREADLYLSGKSIPAISKILRMPDSTVSWHLIHPLEKIDFVSWLRIRKKLNKVAKDKSRAAYEEWIIQSNIELLKNE